MANIREVTPHAAVCFICSPGDEAEIEAIAAIDDERTMYVVVHWEPGQGDFAKKHNQTYAQAVGSDGTDGLLLFPLFQPGWEFYCVGADDLTFHPGWYDTCLAAHERTGACVIGTKDLGNQRTMNGWHSTHFLVHRDYLECGTVDEKGKLFHEGYSHEFCDDECIATARMRRTYSPSQAIVEHNHPDWGKAAWDDTYRKAQADRAVDAELFRQRRHMFGGHR